MELLKLNFKKALFLLVLVTIFTTIEAQTKGIIIDSETMLPIPYVSIHTKGEVVRGSMGNEFGKYRIDFEYDTLYFSHINYELVKLTTRMKSDTVFMNPTVNIMSEIVVTPEDTKWIEVLLKEVVKNKTKNYQTKQAVLEYEFNIKSLSDSSGYAFYSSGNMISPKYSEEEGYKISPVSNVIKYKDKTAGKDFMQLRRSVYNNFIHDFNNSFIKKHQFTRTSFEDQENENLLQFSFKSKKNDDNTGYVVIDTLTKAIIEFEQISGTDYNIKSNISPFARMIGSQSGLKYTIWNTMIRGNFSLIDGSYHLTDCRYQFYRQNEYKEGKETGVFFTNIESILTMKQNNNEKKFEECDWIKLPYPYSIVIILYKDTRLAEEALDRLPAEYELF